MKTVIQFNRLEAAIHEYEMKKRGVHDDVRTSLLHLYHSFLSTKSLKIKRQTVENFEVSYGLTVCS